MGPEQFQETLTSRELRFKQKTANIAGLQLADLLAHPSRCEILNEQGLLGRPLAPFAVQIIEILQEKYDRRGKQYMESSFYKIKKGGHIKAPLPMVRLTTHLRISELVESIWGSRGSCQAKHAIARDLLSGIGFGTTEFHVLRPIEHTIAEWIHFFVRHPSVLLEATEHFTGSVGQQRLPQEYLFNRKLPLPPLAEQRRIAAVLKKQMVAVEKARGSGRRRIGSY